MFSIVENSYVQPGSGFLIRRFTVLYMDPQATNGRPDQYQASLDKTIFAIDLSHHRLITSTW